MSENKKYVLLGATSMLVKPLFLVSKNDFLWSSRKQSGRKIEMMTQFWGVIKKYFFDRVRLIIISIGIILIIIAFSSLGSFDEFMANNVNSLLISLGTNFIGIWITISFVQYFLDKQSEKDEKHQENVTILRYNRVMNILLQRYFGYCFCVTTPIAERNKYDSFTPNTEFVFSDMCDMYKIAALTIDNLMDPVIVSFYKSEDKIHRYVDRMIENIPFEYNMNLAEILMAISEIHLTLDSKEAILGNINIMSGERPLSETVSDYIKSNSDDWVKMFDMGQLQSNIMFPYVLLYKKLKKEIELFNEYQKYIEELKKSEV